MKIVVIHLNELDEKLDEVFEATNSSVNYIPLLCKNLILIDCKEPNEIIKRLKLINIDSTTKLQLLRNIESYSDWKNFLNRNFFVD